MGKGGGSQPTQQNVVQTNLPEYARPYFENIMQRAQAESYRPYQTYEAERISGFTPEQMQTQQETMGLRTPGELGAGSQFAAAGGLGSLGMGVQAAGAGQQYMGMATDPSQIQSFMSPYQQAVTDVQKNAAVREAQIAQQQANLGASRQGTYGGARQAIAQAERERGLLDRLAQIQGQGSQSAFERAQQAQQFGSTLGLQGLQTGLQGMQQLGQTGATLGQLGTSRQAADVQRLQAQEAVGAQRRGLEQQILDQRYADFLRQRDYPMEQLGYFSNLMRGIPVGLGSTQTTYAPPPSLASQVGGLGLAGLSIGRATGAFAEGGEVSSYALGGGVSSKPFEVQSAKDIALEYGGNKQKIAQAAQMGIVDPTAAVMAGMFIDRMRKAQQEEMAPQTTVAQETLPADSMAMEGFTDPTMPAEAGVAALPVPDSMVPDGYAGGGIIAFDVGGTVDPIFGMGQEDFSGSMMPYKELVDLMTLPELQEYNRSGKIPPRLAGQVGGRAIDRPRAIQEPKPVAPVAPAAKPTAPTAPAGVAPDTAAPVQTAAQADDFASYLSRIEGAMPQGQALEGLEKDIKGDREARKAEKSQAGWMSLAMAGLNVASGTSPFALVNLGKGLSEGLKNYADELKDQKKLDREDKKMLADIEKARRDEKRGNVTAALGSYEKALERVSAETRQRIAAEATRYAADTRTRDPLAEFLRSRGGGASEESMKRLEDLLAKASKLP